MRWSRSGGCAGLAHALLAAARCDPATVLERGRDWIAPPDRSETWNMS